MITDKPLIITCPVVGAELTKTDYPHLPSTPSEIAEAAVQAAGAGASIIHLHVRDDMGNPSQEPEIFQEVTEKIKSREDVIVQYSTRGDAGLTFEQRCAPLNLKPEMAALAMGSMNYGEDIFCNSPETIVRILECADSNGIMVELQIYDCSMLETAFRYEREGLLPSKFHLNFVLGIRGGMEGSMENLAFMVGKLAGAGEWTVSGIGKEQLPLAMHAIAMGGHARVGIEDNIFYEKNIFATSSAQLVQRVAGISEQAGRPVADTSRARELLGLS
ncbi:MAG: 3-keto-5-aminohexanoate cleavage protein [Desulfobacteraceae bacterium]